MRKINPDSYQPTGYRVLVRDLPVEKQTKGGIILPETTQSADEFAQQFGHIVRIGGLAFTMETHGGTKPYPDAPRVGDLVNYAKYAGGQFQTDDADNKYRVMNDDDIIGIVERANSA